MPDRVFYGGGRQCGKTTKIMEWMKELSDLAAEDQTQPIPVLVCHTSQAAMQAYRSTFDDDSNPTWAASWQFLGPEEVRGSNPWHRNRIVYGIDNMDLLLSQFVQGGPVADDPAAVSCPMPYGGCHRAERFGPMYRCSTNCQYGQLCEHGFRHITSINREGE